MKEERKIDLITGYLQSSLNEAEHARLNALLEEGKLDPAELAEMETLYRELEAVDVPEPGDQARKRFYSMLETEKEKEKSSRRTDGITEPFGRLQRMQKWFDYRTIGYAAALFLAGLVTGNLFGPSGNYDGRIENLTSEVHQMREIIMISLLENDSPMERLRAVNISSEIPSADNRVVDALLRTLNGDPNVNVRIAAVDALVGHGSNPEVRRGLVNSISTQESPHVQIALADAMIALQERGATDQFQKLLENEEMDENVRTKLENTILALN